ncbi:MAG: uroporphyrinogen-III synthase [Halioglobus sp.]
MASEPVVAPIRVLVTRPAGEAADTLCAAVNAAGYDAFSQPLLELQGLSQLSAQCRQMLLDLDRYEHVIFISSNAVRFGMALVNDFWPQLPVGLHWYAVGGATAEELQRFGITAITPGSIMTSEGLLAVPALQQVQGQRVLIVKGEGGRDALRQELIRRGAAVDELACYRRCIPTLPAGELAAMISRWQIDVILVSSGEGLANFQLLLSPSETSKFKGIGMVVPSKRVAEMARYAGFDHVVTAENASDAAMLHALQQWRSGTGD